jgi:hypothetical protein
MSGTLQAVPATMNAASHLAATGDAELLRPFLATVSSVVPQPLLPAPSTAPLLIAEKHARKKMPATADGSVCRSSRIASKKKEEAARALLFRSSLPAPVAPLPRMVASMMRPKLAT